MKKAFEIVPLLVAAALGAVLWTIINNTTSSNANTGSVGNGLLYGALTGIGVQIGVRLLGVS
jgi:hypothetical protein